MYPGFEAEIEKIKELHQRKFVEYGEESITSFGPSYLMMRVSIKAGKLRRFLLGEGTTVKYEEELQDIIVTSLLALAAIRNGEKVYVLGEHNDGDKILQHDK